MFQTPLNVALAASPLFFLTTRTLAALSLGKQKVFEVVAHSPSLYIHSLTTHSVDLGHIRKMTAFFGKAGGK